jgi:TRAP-type transport system small permease protein
MPAGKRSVPAGSLLPASVVRENLAMLVSRLWGAVEFLVKAVLVALVAVMVAVSLAQVFWRYVFHDPLIWSEELARYAFVWIAYLSAWLTWKHRAHIALDAIAFLKLPDLERWAARLVEVLILAFCLYTFHSNIRLLGLTLGQPSAILEIPMAYVYGGYSAMTFLICGDILATWLASWLAGRAGRAAK